MELALAARRQVTGSQVAKYAKATRAEKQAILDHLCAVNGWHRDHARKALRRAAAGPPAPRRPRDPAYTYGPEVIEALRFCWAVQDGPTGKRLAPVMALLVESLRRHGELTVSDAVAGQLVRMSAATIDRRLAPDRAQLVLKGRSMTKPGTLLKSQIPIKTWAEWNDQTPGFCEVDLVGHDGGDNNGVFCWSLTVSDVATGWTEVRTVRSKGERVVADALQQIQLALPFHLAGIHSDNGSEFINHHLLRWCDTRQITFTRGRPNHKNDNAHVEQKNWSIVRRCAGYFRYDTPREQRLLDEMWQLESIMFNLFTAQQKLVSKTRVGAKVTKRYDLARTPADRLLTDHDLVTDQDRAAIETLRHDRNPAALRRRIGDIQSELIYLARRRGQVKPQPNRHHVYDSRTKIKNASKKRALSDESTNAATRAS